MSELPRGWTTTKFTEVLDISGGTQPPKSEFIPAPQDGYIRLLQIRDFGEKPVPTFIPDNGKRKTCRKDDVLIGRYGASIGRICTGMEGAYNVALAKVIKPDFIEGGFLKYYLMSENFQQPLRLLSRSAQNGFNKKDLSNFDFVYPPLEEQKRIADKLDSVLAKVEAAQARLDKIPAILKRFRQSVLAAATSGELTKEWRENAGIDFLYQEFKVSEVASDEKYSLAIGPFGSNLKVKDYRDDGHPLVFVREIRSKKFGGLKTKYVDSNKFSELAAHKVKPGDVLITKMGDPPGDVAIYPIRRPEAIITSDCIKITPNENIVSSKYLTIVFESFDFKKKIKSITAGVAQQKVSLKKFKELIIALPTRCEQEEISKRFLELEEMAACAEKQYLTAKSRLDKLTQSVLAKAFKGELFNDFVELENSITDQINKLEAV